MTYLDGRFFPVELDFSFGFLGLDFGFSGVASSVFAAAPMSSGAIPSCWVLVSMSPPLMGAEEPASAAMIPAAPIPFFWSDSEPPSVFGCMSTPSPLSIVVIVIISPPGNEEEFMLSSAPSSGPFFFLDLKQCQNI